MITRSLRTERLHSATHALHRIGDRSSIHEALENCFVTGSRAGIQAPHATEIGRLLAQLDQAGAAREMNLPGWRLHELEGSMAGCRSVTVNGKWRITFRFTDGDAEVVEYVDDH